MEEAGKAAIDQAIPCSTSPAAGDACALGSGLSQSGPDAYLECMRLLTKSKRIATLCQLMGEAGSEQQKAEYQAELAQRSQAAQVMDAAIWLADALGLDAEDLEEAGKEGANPARKTLSSDNPEKETPSKPEIPLSMGCKVGGPCLRAAMGPVADPL